MSLTSSTGLLASAKKPITRKNQEKQPNLEFNDIAIPAPYVLRPFAGLYNPFPYGCSILCNHPADFEAKDVVRRAKETWANEGKPILLPEELNALRANAISKQHHMQQLEDGDEMVPEELFRRYTETDSRPLTPAPTLASVLTHGSTKTVGRRCFTPDPIPSHPINERPLLVLDLRRTQSQETLSWHGGPGGPVPKTVLQPPTRSPTPSSASGTVNKRGRKINSVKKTSTEIKADDHENDNGNKFQQQVLKTLPPPVSLSDNIANEKKDDEEEIQRRRGRQRKKGKKHSRDLSSALEKEFQCLPEPGETQVSAFGNESQTGSARPSLSVIGFDGMLLSPRGSFSARGNELNCNPGSSYLDTDVLKLLSRELDREIIDNEFDAKRRIVLEEAMKMFPPESRPPPSEEMMKLKRELRLPPTDTELWLSLPRTFSRQSARFDLPLDMEIFSKMTPVEYIQQHVHITSGRRMLYNLVFNRHRENAEEENVERRLLGEKIILALGEMMGRPMTEEEGIHFQNLVGWKNDEYMDFRTWCGLCALCERILGPEFSSQVLSQDQDPRHDIEKADFDTLARKLLKTNPNPQLVTILKSIRDL